MDNVSAFDLLLASAKGACDAGQTIEDALLKYTHSQGTKDEKKNACNLIGQLTLRVGELCH